MHFTILASILAQNENGKNT